MKRILPVLFSVAVILLVLGILNTGCKKVDRGVDSGGSEKDTTVVSVETEDSSTVYNIYIENSGSMKGFFSGKISSDLEILIKDYYDRMTSENVVEGDTVTLNYINTGKEDSKLGVKEYLSTAKSKCTAKYTKIDDILEMAMSNASEKTVNIVISDFAFDSNQGSCQTAQSSIEKLFTIELKSNPGLTVAILKYEAGFNGIYYPGGIQCKQDLPVYFWIFGAADRVKKVLDLNVKQAAENSVLLQLSSETPFELSADNKRAIEKNELVVKGLLKERNGDAYKFSVIADLSKTILSEDSIMSVNSYSVNSSTSSKYSIESIEKNGYKYTFVIVTDRPSPGELSLAYDLSLPLWVEDSDYSGNGIPPYGKTYGIKYLIEGVYDAYHNKTTSYFTIKINLK
ncbi:MAG: hypothetical protein ACI30M_04090 [Muribaculaceae bacterium]